MLAAIGNQPPGAGQTPFDGLIDDVQLYRRALTPAEVQTLASGVPPPKILISRTGVSKPSGRMFVV